MPSATDIRELERRPRRYWNIDGIPELVMGLVWLAWGAALLVGERLPPGGAWKAYWLVVPAILVMSGVAANRVTAALKHRFTYPRSGYVVLPEPSRTLRIATAAVVVVAAGLVASLVARARLSGAGDTTPMAVGIVVALSFLALSVRQGAPHLLALAGVALMLGVAIGTLGAGVDGLNWLIALLGVASAALGAFRLSRFVRQHPLGGME